MWSMWNSSPWNLSEGCLWFIISFFSSILTLWTLYLPLLVRCNEDLLKILNCVSFQGVQYTQRLFCSEWNMNGVMCFKDIGLWVKWLLGKADLLCVSKEGVDWPIRQFVLQTNISQFSGFGGSLYSISPGINNVVYSTLDRLIWGKCTLWCITYLMKIFDAVHDLYRERYNW